MNILFWFFVAIDVALFVVLLVLGFTDHGHSDGGREMALIFSILLPGAIVALAALRFLKAGSPMGRVIGLVLVAGPGLLLGGIRLRSAVIDRQVRQNSLGRGYFNGSAQKDAGEAVVSRDTAALRTLAPQIKVNEVGDHGMTLLKLAVDQAFDTTSSHDRPTPIAVIETLLALGADANQGIEAATKHPDPAILTALLKHGGNANTAGDHGPVVFEWLGVMPLANFLVLADHGLDLNILDSSGTPLLVQLGRADRWDLAAAMLARGANQALGDREGMTLADVVKQRLTSDRFASGEPREALLKVKALLDQAK